MVQVTKNFITKKDKKLFITIEISSAIPSILFKVEDKDGRLLFSAEFKTRRGIIVLLECFYFSGDSRKDKLIDIKKHWKSHIVITPGKIAEEHEQLLDKPSGEDEMAALSSHFDNIESMDIWQLIRDTGFHELIPTN